MDNTKYDVSINAVPYRISGYSKSELSTFIPRLGGGEQKDSQFDLLRSASIKGFAGGMLQRFWNDDTSMFAIEGMFPKFDDGVLYPVNEPATLTSNNPLGASKSRQTAHVVCKDYVFVASVTYNTPTNSIRRIDSAGTVTTLTLPASLSGSGVITSMVIWKDQLWVSTGYDSMWYMSLSSTTLIDVTAGTVGYLTKLVVYRGSLYGTSGSNQNRDIYRYTGDTSSKSFELVGTSGKQDNDPNATLLVYNNRIMLLRQDGMFAYDGIQMVTVEDSSANINIRNYRFPVVLRGYLYYFMPDGWYRFNGSLIEKLYDTSEIGFPVDVITGKNRIWILYRNSQYSGVSRYDKSMGYDYGLDDNPADGRVAVYDGKGLFTYGRTPVVDKTLMTDVEDQGEVYRMFWFKDDLFITTYYENIAGNQYYKIDTDELTATGDKGWRVISSIYDGDFPQVDKNFENLELTFDGNLASQSLTLEYRTAGFDSDTGWTSFGTINTTTERKRYTWKTITAGLTFRKIQFRVTGDTDAEYGMEKLILRFTITPDFKWQWQFTVHCYGDQKYAPLNLADNLEGSQLVSLLRGNIYDARDSDTPILFIDCDQLDLNGAINSAVTTVTLDSTAMLKGQEGFIKIDNEIMYYSVRTSTTLTVLRGQLGTTSASHVDNSKVFVIYRAIVRNIINERVEMQDAGSDDITANSSRPSEITVLLQEV